MDKSEKTLDKVDEPLQDVMRGWRKNHAEAYRCLVAEGPLEASEIIVRTSIPRGRIYDILDDLENEGVVNHRDRNPTRYTAVHPKSVIQERKEAFDRKANKLIETLGNAYELNPPAESDNSAWVLDSRAGITRKVRDVLKDAEECVYAIEPDPRWYETRDCRQLERLHRDGGEVKPVMWSGRQKAIERNVSSFNFPVWTCDEVTKMFYIVDKEYVVFGIGGNMTGMGGEDTGIVFRDEPMAKIFTNEFEDTFKRAAQFDNNE